MVDSLSTWRLFVGIDIPSAERSMLAAMIGALGPLPGRPVPPENWHLTLRFLGDVDEVRRDRVMAELDMTDLGDAFGVRVHGLGAFPNSNRATVLWAGVDGGALDGLASQVGVALEGAGFEVEDRPFRPHLTLSRIRPPQRVSALTAEPFGPLRMEVDQVVMFRSHLGGGGVSYEVIERFPLDGRRNG